MRVFLIIFIFQRAVSQKPNTRLLPYLICNSLYRLTVLCKYTNVRFQCYSFCNAFSPCCCSWKSYVQPTYLRKHVRLSSYPLQWIGTSPVLFSLIPPFLGVRRLCFLILYSFTQFKLNLFPLPSFIQSIQHYFITRCSVIHIVTMFQNSFFFLLRPHLLIRLETSFQLTGFLTVPVNQ